MMVYDIAALQFLYGKASSSESAQTSVVSAISDNLIAGDKVKLTIDSTDYEYPVVSGDSSADVMSKLADLVNAGKLAKATVLKASQGSGDNLREYSYLSLTGAKTGATEGAFTATTTITDVNVRAGSLSGGAVIETASATSTVKEVKEMAAVTNGMPGDKIGLTISGKTFSYTVVDGDDSADIATGLKTLINAGSTTAVADDSAADGTLEITAKAFNVTLSVGSASLTQRVITGGAVATPVAASDARMASFQELDFTDSWNGLQTVWTPTDADGTGGTFNASAVTTRTIIDMRPGAFSSVNRYNNIGLSFGSQYSSVLGGNKTDVIYAGLYSASINGGAESDTVYLAGKASDYSLVADANGVATSNPGTVTRKVNGEDITLTLTNVEKLKFYDDTRVGSLHGVDSFA
jgi:phage tail sheath gpL-like